MAIISKFSHIISLFTKTDGVKIILVCYYIYNRPHHSGFFAITKRITKNSENKEKKHEHKVQSFQLVLQQEIL